MRSRKGSLEIGINTIVILVIAMVLLGLGIGFIRNIFESAGGIPDTLDPSVLTTPPTSSEPLRITPSEITVKAGESETLTVGVYNTDPSTLTYNLNIGACSGATGTPELKTVPQQIENGQTGAYRVIITAEYGGTNMDTGEYVCSMRADGGSTSFEEQFFLTVVG